MTRRQETQLLCVFACLGGVLLILLPVVLSTPKYWLLDGALGCLLLGFGLYRLRTTRRRRRTELLRGPDE